MKAHVRDYHPNVEPWLRTYLDDVRGKQTLKTFALSITDRCNIACDFCCHPYMNSDLPEDEAIRLVTEAVEEDYDEICVTGGEPMLRRDLIMTLARICRAKEKLFGLITNAFWAKSERAAAREIHALYSAGVRRITVSWDESHGAFIKPEKADYAIAASIEAGMKVSLVGSFKKKGQTHKDFGIDIERYKAFRNFGVLAHAASAAGNGEQLELDEWDRADLDFLKNDTKNAICPAVAIQETVVFSKNGLIQPCCSIYAGYKAPYLSIGDWRTMSVKEMKSLHEGDPYFTMIRAGGFKHLYDVIRKHDPDLLRAMPDPQKSPNVCHLCASLMRTSVGSRIREICRRELDATLDDFFEILETQAA